MKIFNLTACENTDHGAKDSTGDTCGWYDENNEYCGDYDDDDFDARELCCACKTIGNSIF